MRAFVLLFPALLLASPVRAQQPAVASLPLLVQQLAHTPEPLPTLPLKEARRTLPQARQRYLRGLPAGTGFYLTARVLNEAATPEPVVILVDTWQGTHISGRIVRLAPDGRPTPGATADFEETAVLDWILLRANGAEEGNFLGKYLDLEERLAALQD
ncbi:hypothetical protein [Hymenobacter sp. DG01]|uniref:hypothetical protein n=1 Tax=Hymenobacter sp. DG01 TaxID=2584940 RepID=UPI0011243261|nr:hypothetical protein [Hymenobacter sp. DG01]